jgi:protease I
MKRHNFQQAALLLILFMLVLGCNGTQPESAPTPTATPTELSPLPDSEPNRVLLVLYDQFEEREYGDTRATLEAARVTTFTAANSETVEGHQGSTVAVDVLLSAARAEHYDAVVFIGGYGYDRDDPQATRLAREAADAGIVLAAICVAPITLANADVIEGVMVTSSLPAEVFESAGAIFVGTPVVRDGLIITGNGPDAASLFGETIVEALND